MADISTMILLGSWNPPGLGLCQYTSLERGRGLRISPRYAEAFDLARHRMSYF